jgi:hypothetical protein
VTVRKGPEVVANSPTSAAIRYVPGAPVIRRSQLALPESSVKAGVVHCAAGAADGSSVLIILIATFGIGHPLWLPLTVTTVILTAPRNVAPTCPVRVRFSGGGPSNCTRGCADSPHTSEPYPISAHSGPLSSPGPLCNHYSIEQRPLLTSS